jgi:hypothetical protein
LVAAEAEKMISLKAEAQMFPKLLKRYRLSNK